MHIAACMCSLASDTLRNNHLTVHPRRITPSRQLLRELLIVLGTESKLQEGTTSSSSSNEVGGSNQGRGNVVPQVDTAVGGPPLGRLVRMSAGGAGLQVGPAVADR